MTERAKLNARIVEALERAHPRALTHDDLARELGEPVSFVEEVSNLYSRQCWVPGHPSDPHLHDEDR